MRSMKHSYANLCTMRSILVLACIAIGIAAPNISQAAIIRGHLKADEKNETLHLVTAQSQTPLRIVSRGSGIHQALKSLRDGDFITARGQHFQKEGAVIIDAIESVGLRELLGIWTTAQWQIFEFRDFNRLNLYMDLQKWPGLLNINESRAMDYFLAPASGNRYSIFMSDDQSVLVGTLEVTTDRIDLTLFDSRTGRPSENISLSPLILK